LTISDHISRLYKEGIALMKIRIFNTLTKKKEIFEPVEPQKVRMYVCGPTVYDSSHIGHARSVVVFDVIVRYLRKQGYDVTYVRNFTDIDDKIIKRANELGIDSKELAEKYITEFYEDMDALNVQRATLEPRATEHISDIIQVVQKLIQKKTAYPLDGDVYFSIESFKEYGKLSGRKLEDMEAGARVAVDERKHNPFDFALWKSAKPGEPSWESPWGKGRPGWHIECTAMSSSLLGETIDIHGGGKDLVFPHHENEIAQSEAAFGKNFVRYWIHNGFVNINQEKMSKSLGNFLLIKDIIKMYHPESVRLFLLSNHYRSPIDFNEKAMEEASGALEKIYTFLERAGDQLGISAKVDNTAGQLWQEFCDAMNDDFNTAQGLGTLFSAVRNLNRILDESGERLSDKDAEQIKSGYSDVLEVGNILGILQCPPKTYFEQKRLKGIKEESIDPQLIEKMVHERTEARKSKDWAKADKIRAELLEMKIVLEDRADGTVWKYND
jgi:cysteinyl-tRNA synthetase